LAYFKTLTGTADTSRDVYFHLEQNFPKGLRSLERLAKQDREVAALLADYEELCTWVATVTGASANSRASKASELSHAQEIIRDLEEEIRKKIGGLDERIE
jgi:hypothetical protein